MTISTLASQTIQYGNSSKNQFYGAFPIVSANDVQVIYTDSNGQQTTLTPTQYLVTIPPPDTGEIWSTSFYITYPLLGPPIADGTSLTISRDIPLTQTTVLSNQGPFYPQVVESALDTNLMQLQQVSARTGQLRGAWVAGIAYNFGDIVVDGVNGNDTGNLYVCTLSNISGTWATDLVAGDWSLALNVQGIVNSLPSIGDNQVFANISGGSAAPTGVAVSALLDSAIGSTQGDVLYRSASGWVVLPPGTNGQVFTTGGAAANPSWTSASGAGTITGVTAGTGLAGGGVTGGVTLAFATIANNALIANVSGGTLAPSATTISAFLDGALGSTQGNILYRGGSVWTVLTPGTAGQSLITGGAGANPSWASVTSPIKAWCVFNGTLAGTNAPTSGSNVTSVTRNSTGEYTINFTNALADANYAISGSAVASDSAGYSVTQSSGTAPTTGAVRVHTSIGASGSFDTARVSIIIVGN